MKKLSEIATIFSGNAWKAGSFRTNGKLPIIRIQNIGKNKSNDFVYWDEDYKDSFIVNKGEILLSLSGSIKLDIWDGPPALLNQRIVKITPNAEINSKWLFYQLSKYVRKIELMGRNAVVNNVSLPDLKKISFNVPPLSDQLHIANLLSKAENLIVQRKESIRLLDEFLKSTFLEMFGDPVRNEKGWEMLSGNDYLSRLTVGVVIKPASYYVSEGVIALRSLNIRPNRIQLDNLVYFSKSVNENELSKSILREGDVVFVRTGMTGTAAIIPKELDGCNCIDLIVTRPKSGVINPQYLVFFFNSDIGKRIVSAKEVGGIQKHFNIGALRKLEIPVPPIELQTQFAQIVEKTEAIKTQYQQSLQELENLYGSLSQKAFRGELVSKQKESKVVALTPETKVAQPELNKQQAFLRKLMLASHIIYELCDEPTFGHTKLMKLLYLSEQAGGMALQTNYKKFAAGPFDGKTLTLIDKEFEKNKWFTISKKPFSANGQQREATVYRKTDKSLLYKKHFDNYFESETDTINRIIELFRKENTQTTEIVATLYFAWKELIMANTMVSKDSLVKSFYQFHKEKKKFTEEQILLGYEYMLKNELYPQ